jgi:hypothetical protein
LISGRKNLRPAHPASYTSGAQAFRARDPRPRTLVPRECGSVFQIRGPSLRGALATKQSILSLRGEMDCFAEPVIGRRLAPTRWLAIDDEEVSPASSPPTRAPSRGVASETRSAHLTIFWRCGLSQFSSRTGAEAAVGNEPSMVLAEDRASKGSGNADSQRNAWSSREIGRYCRCLRDSGCVPAHPASLRASASYLPLRAVWAVCAWALRGCARSSDPFSA